MAEVVAVLKWAQIEGRKHDHVWVALADGEARVLEAIGSLCGSYRVPAETVTSGRRCPTCLGRSRQWIREATETGSRIDYGYGDDVEGPVIAIYAEGSFGRLLATALDYIVSLE